MKCRAADAYILRTVFYNSSVDQCCSVFDSIWTLSYPCGKRMNMNLCLMPFTKINPKWVKDLNVKDKTLKCLENTQENIYDLGVGKDKYICGKIYIYIYFK